MNELSMRTEDKILRFVKMQGLGNDYIYIDLRFVRFDDGNMPKLARRFSDRHFGIGGDGVVFVCHSERADATMRMFNADGSEGKMCGNAIRCIAKYLYDGGLKKEVVTVETAVGIKTLRLNVLNGKVNSVTADMGFPSFKPEDVGLSLTEKMIGRKLILTNGESFDVTCLSMGNPHCVVFTDDFRDFIEKAEMIQREPVFTEGVNVEFVRPQKNGLEMRVLERGSGETLACGTGACAAAVAAHTLGYVDASQGTDVFMRGGTLRVKYSGKTVEATGETEEVFRGEITL